MPETDRRTYHIPAAETEAAPEVRIRHPFNPNSEIFLRRLTEPAGLERVALRIARVPPGKESFAYHAHEAEEEFLYILSGRGRAEIEGREIEVGPGDFMGFPPKVAHHLTNPYGEDLVYLMGGTRSALDIGHFPKLGRRLIFTGGAEVLAVEDAEVRRMSMAEWFPDGLAPGKEPSPLVGEGGPKGR
jgi:uncharacterized cupin superfamily protein